LGFGIKKLTDATLLHVATGANHQQFTIFHFRFIWSEQLFQYLLPKQTESFIQHDGESEPMDVP
jgi:hypothetical protein